MDRRPIPDYPGYEIDRDGNFWSEWDKRWEKGSAGCKAYRSGVWRRVNPSPHKSGYIRVNLRHKSGKMKRGIKAHILVCTAWHGPKPAKEFEVLHGDSDRQNNRPDNLRWGTKEENGIDKAEAGSCKGELNGSAKRTQEEIVRIKCLIWLEVSDAEIAEIVGWKSDRVGEIRRGERWGHVRLPEEPAPTPAEHLQGREVVQAVVLEPPLLSLLRGAGGQGGMAGPEYPPHGEAAPLPRVVCADPGLPPGPPVVRGPGTSAAARLAAAVVLGRRPVRQTVPGQ
jgi:hypothetical protein